jgi:aarF domain-containing kinase
MTFNIRKNTLKLFDSLFTGCLTVNKILSSSSSSQNKSGIKIDLLIKPLQKEIIMKNSNLKLQENIMRKNVNTANEIVFPVEKKIANNISRDIKEDKVIAKVNSSTSSTITNNPTINNTTTTNINPITTNATNPTIPNLNMFKSNETKDTVPKSTPSIHNNPLIEDDPFLIKSDKIKFVGKHSKIPVSSFARAMNFGLLGISMVGSTFSHMLYDKVSFKQSDNQIDSDKGYSKYFINESNAERLSRTLCRMRGAALKFGQILSTFEDLVIPEVIRSALEKARAEADIMPHSQLIKVLKAEYGKNWREKFKDFNEEPFAAASIGQVHEAVLHDGRRVAVKVQYPGVAQSIDSDLNNIKRVFEYLKIFPKGMYVDDLVKNIGNELRMECDYIQEAEKQMTFKSLLSNDSFLFVPSVVKDFSTKLILCSEFIEGTTIDEISNLPQDIRDQVGSKILELTLRELFEFNFMQTDPNPANFFYDKKKNILNLIDFGAARTYEKDFVDKYMKIVYAAAVNDKDTVVKMSKEIGFLTGMENNLMIDSHCQATLAVGEPFNIDNIDDMFDFGNQNLTRKIYKLIPTMLKHRLKPPPTEIYSLHRKLSGAYLICIKLKAKVASRTMFFNLYDRFYRDRFVESFAGTV